MRPYVTVPGPVRLANRPAGWSVPEVGAFRVPIYIPKYSAELTPSPSSPHPHTPLPSVWVGGTRGSSKRTIEGSTKALGLI